MNFKLISIYFGYHTHCDQWTKRDVLFLDMICLLNTKRTRNKEQIFCNFNN